MAGKMTATMVVDLRDKTGAGVRTVIGNLDRLKRAERELELAQRGANLRRTDRAMENLMIARQQEAQERKANMMMWAARGATAVAAVAASQVAAYTKFAEAEDRVNRIAITSEKGFGTVRNTMRDLQKVANDAYLPIEKVTSGLDALVASGRSMEESMAFLPSVAMTAQASGAAVEDIARSSDALAGSLGISATEMQHAFDILVAGGKAGKFELKDMAQYLPSLLPAFSALGYKGTDGLEKMVAMLQIVRNQAGSSGEAATYLSNVFQKMETEETRKKFKKMGVDLSKGLNDARKSGKDVLEVFLDLTQKATKGDLSKIPLLFGDSEMQKGVRALIMQRDALNQMRQSLKGVDGSTMRDFNQAVEGSAAKIQRLMTLLDKLATQSGARAAEALNPILETVTDQVDRREAAAAAREGMSAADRARQQVDFQARYKAVDPDAGTAEIRKAYEDALVSVGRKQSRTVFQNIERLEQQIAANDGRRAGGERQIRLGDPSRGSYGDKGALGSSTGQIPIPLRKPTAGERRELALAAAEELNRASPSRGTYDPRFTKKDGSFWSDLIGPKTETDKDVFEAIRLLSQRPASRPAVTQNRPLDAPLVPLPLAASMALDEARRARQLGFGGTTGTMPGKAADDVDMGRRVSIEGTPSVSLSGTPTVALAGPVTIANMPPPSIFNFVINEASDAQAVARAVGQYVDSAKSGVQASTGDFGN